MSVQNHLSTTASNLVLTSNENSSISTSVSTLQKRLGEHFGSNMIEHFMFGSNTRNTILPRKVDSYSDVDYMIVFDNSDNKKPQAYLDRLKKFAETKYSTSEIVQSYPTIVLNLNHIKFELVPASKAYYGGYYIPKKGYSGDEWIYTDPTDLNQKLTDKNKSHDFQIKPLVRLIKYWNAQNDYVYDSFKLEEYVIAQYYLYKNIKDMFFSLVDGLSTGNLSQNSTDKVNRLKTIVNKTRELERNGYPVSAEDEIKKVIPFYSN